MVQLTHRIWITYNRICKFVHIFCHRIFRLCITCIKTKKILICFSNTETQTCVACTGCPIVGIFGIYLFIGIETCVAPLNIKQQFHKNVFDANISRAKNIIHRAHTLQNYPHTKHTFVHVFQTIPKNKFPKNNQKFGVYILFNSREKQKTMKNNRPTSQRPFHATVRLHLMVMG